MKALSIIAHGSRNPAANQEFLRMAEQIKSQLESNYDLIDACFLELTDPRLMQSCKGLIEQGATSIDVYPLFFNCGNHVSKDLPALATSIQQETGMPISLLPYFGKSEQLISAAATHIALLNNR